MLAPKCSTSKEEMSKDTEGTVEIGNLRSSCDQFMASAYFKKSKININVNKPRTLAESTSALIIRAPS